MSAGELLEAARRAVELTAGSGVVAAEAYVQDQHDLEIRVFDRAVESLTEAGSRGIGIRAFAADGRSGYAYGTAFDDAALGRLAARAVELAEASDPDEFDGLPEATGSGDTGELVAPDIDEFDTSAKIELAVRTDAAAREYDERVSQVEQTIYSDGRTRVSIANSDGFAGDYESSGAYAWSSAFAGSGDELMTGLGLGIARGPAALDAEAIGREAAERALAMIGARRASPRTVPVVFDEFTAASLIGIAAGALSGEAVVRGRSPFVGKMGEAVASDLLVLTDDGLIADGLAAAPFDGEGVAQRATRLIAGGEIENLLYDSRTAREAGAVSTGNARRASYRSGPGPGATNLVVDAGHATLEELFSEAGDGLYVTNLVGLHSGVNPVSGQFSVGASGIEIKGGKLAAPVREATIAGDLISALQGVRGVGGERRWIPFGGMVLTGPLLIDQLAIA